MGVPDYKHYIGYGYMNVNRVKGNRPLKPATMDNESREDQSTGSSGNRVHTAVSTVQRRLHSDAASAGMVVLVVVRQSPIARRSVSWRNGPRTNTSARCLCRRNN